MGKRRRFTQLASTSDDDEDAAAMVKTKSKSTLTAAVPVSKKQRRRPDDEELQLEEEEEEEELEEMREEEEEEVEETQNRRRRGRRKQKRRADESDEEAAAAAAEAAAAAAAPEDQEGEAREEESTEAVPLGDPVKVTGKGKKQRTHYTSFEYEGNTFELEDPVLLTPEDRKEKPYVAIIKDITEIKGNLMVTGQWFYRPEEAEKKGGGSWVARDTRELFYSFHIDDVPAESVMHKCVVHFIPQHKQLPIRKQHPGFIVQKVYDAVAKKLWNLTDKDYEDNKQHEIDLLVKKTMDRIGDLPDLGSEGMPADTTDQLSNKRSLRRRPLNPIDVSKDAPTGKSDHFTKAETPGSDTLKNYAILSKYKALTGDQVRDKWLDKFVDAIPLAFNTKESALQDHKGPAGAAHGDPSTAANKGSTNGASAKDNGSSDNGKAYTPDVVVPVMAFVERSAHEALGSDFQKYNQKLRQLLFNIKNSPILARRLMNKELDPPVLLTMSPDELKAGLTAAEKATSEPEESRQLQMTDARCERCAEKKVGISEIIHASHGDRYQLECISCGYTWFSSRDAISSLSVDAPSTCGNVGTAPWATAKFDVLEKQLVSPREQPDKPPADVFQKSTAAYVPTLEKQKSFNKPKSDEPTPVPAADRE